MKVVLIATSIIVLMLAVLAANLLPSRHEASYPRPYYITRGYYASHSAFRRGQSQTFARET